MRRSLKYKCKRVAQLKYKSCVGLGWNISEEGRFTEEELTKQRLDEEIAEAKQYLASTDHKFYKGYKPKEGKDLATMKLREMKQESL